MAKRNLTWELVPEDEMKILDDTVNTYGDNFPPKKNTVINAEHPQEGLFPPHFNEYMQYWPANIAPPASLVIEQNEWESSTHYNHYYGTSETDWEAGPKTVLTMPNGATFTLLETDPWGDNAPEEIFEGDWSAYADMDSDEIRDIIDVVTEGYALSDETEESLSIIKEKNREA